MNSRAQSFIIYFLLIIAIGAMLYVGFRQDSNAPQPLTINQVAQAIQNSEVARVIIQSDTQIHIVYKSGKEADSNKESSATLVDQLVGLGVTPAQLSPNNVLIEVQSPSPWAGILSSLLYILPVIFMAGVLWFIFRQAQGSNNAAMAFGKSRARMFSGEHPTVTFQDVAGFDESKKELAEVVEFFKERRSYSIRRTIPKGVLFVGRPVLARHSCRAVVGEAGVPFFSLSGSEFVSCSSASGKPRARLFEWPTSHRASCLSMKSMQSVVNAAQASAAQTMNANRLQPDAG